MSKQWFCSVAVLSLVLAASAAEDRLTATRSTLEKWVETRQLTAKTKADWQADKETLEQTIQLLERELKGVEEQRSKLSTNNAQVRKEWAEAEALKKSSNEMLDRGRQFATGLEDQLKKLAPQLPAPLQETLKPLLNKFPTDPAAAKNSVAERIQVCVGMLNEVDKFNNAVTVASERRKDSQGEEVSVETVYVGFGAAYFVNDAGNFAGTGAPGPQGWVWTNKPEIAASVREVVRIYRNERPARFVPLPAVIR